MAVAGEGDDISKAKGDRAMPGSEWELRMDNTLLMALKKGDARTVERFFSRAAVLSSEVADHALAINLPDADNNIVADGEAGRRTWRGVTEGRKTALHVVATFGHFELAKLICTRDSSFLRARNVAGETPLHCAARAGADQIVSLFISVARQQEDRSWLEAVLRATDREGKTALQAAAEEGHAAAARVLMSADPGLAAIDDGNGVSPLYAAVLSGSLEAVQILIESESPAEGGQQDGTTSASRVAPEASYAGPNGQTALHAAALRHPATPLEDAVRQLLERDTSTAYLSDCNGFFPIHVAASMGRRAVAIVLITHCNDMDELVDKEGRNFLHIAVQFDEPAIVEFVSRQPLLAKMMNGRDYKGNTPLHLAVKFKNQKIVSLLLGNRRVHHSIINKDGLAPIDLAITQREQGLAGAQGPEDWIIQCLQRTGAVFGPRRLDPLINQKANEPDLKKELKKYESTTQNLIIVSALIATVTFAAAFTMPGGYRADDHQNGGTPTLTRKYAFAAFIISDVLAFLCSIIATTWLMLAGSLATDPSRRVNLILRSGPLILIAVQSMIAAFALSVYVVLAPVSIVIAVVVCVLACPSLLLSDTELWQRLHLERTVKSRLGWSAMNRTRAIFRAVAAYLVVYVVIVVLSLFYFVKH
ncbi:ankyrin repeat-containing protein At5g02620-like isoform X2 [Ananas comosus]|uniref:Ankyrin repeat-containing protein At5g02620-like isoform X2 n=1 Tax=Ananas comosus TaxID=4615 RepID=A0A6P5GVA0_ANACO|nr:ankyrin repeat-containing protein At5g02620-like isoform X2 [Ananas comosus]